MKTRAASPRTISRIGHAPVGGPAPRVGRSLSCAIILAAFALAGCTTAAKPSPGYSNLSFRDAGGTEVARGWLDLPARLPGPGKSFGGAFRLVSSRGDFPSSAVQTSDRYAAFVGEGGWTFNANLNPGVADHNVTLAGKLNTDEVRGTWALSTFGGARPGGTFVLGWERK